MAPPTTRTSRIASALCALGLTATVSAGNCPPPPVCAPAAEHPACTTTETFTFSSTFCFGEVPSQTETMEITVGGETGADICVGAERSVGFWVCPGTTNYNTNYETVYDMGRIFADGFEQP